MNTLQLFSASSIRNYSIVAELPGALQQSAERSAFKWKSPQFLSPHTRPGLHSESESQSPPPSGHGDDEEQQDQSVDCPAQGETE